MSAEPCYPASPTHLHPVPTMAGGELGAHENSVNTSMNNLPRNRTPSPTPPHVSSHQDPHWTVLACLCSLQNAKAARRLHEVDKQAEWTEMKTQLTAKEKNKLRKKRDSFSVIQLVLFLKTSLSSSIRCHDQRCWGSYQCVCVCVCTQSPFLSIRHYSFKSHLRIVCGLLETGLDQLLYVGMFFEWHILWTVQEYLKVLWIALMFNPLLL